MTPDDELPVKRERVSALLDALDLDALLLATPPSVAWITCGGDAVVDLTAAEGVAAVLCTRTGETLLANTIEQARLLDEALPQPPDRVEVFGWHESTPALAARRLRPDARIGADLALADFADCTEAVRSLRLILSAPELERYHVLGRDAGEAVEAVAGTVAPGQSELEIAGALAAASYSRGAAPIVVLVAGDERIARYRHPLPTARRVERYALLVLCARRHGLVASVTRAVHVGPLPDELRGRQEACARVDAAFLAATRPGATAGDVFRAGVAAYAAEGFPEEWRLHHQGGAAGYRSREWIAVPGGGEPLQDGMAFAWNPSITGVKSEDTVLLHGGRLEIATQTETGRWPLIEARAGAATFRRPGILER